MMKGKLILERIGVDRYLLLYNIPHLPSQHCVWMRGESLLSVVRCDGPGALAMASMDLSMAWVADCVSPS